MARDIFVATSYILGYRLPEFYAGLPRQPGTFPVQYVGANIPQVWAAGSIFQRVQKILGLRVDAPWSPMRRPDPAALAPGRDPARVIKGRIIGGRHPLLARGRSLAL